MSWHMSVRHRTGYRYEGPVRSSYNEARLTPPTVDGQQAVQTELAVTPAVRLTPYIDYWGTMVHAFDVHVPHTELVVLATSTVRTAGPRPAPPETGWATLADPALRDRLADYLGDSTYVTAEPELTELGRSLRAGRTPRQAGERAAEWTHETLRYERGATTVRTSSAQARAGTCCSPGAATTPTSGRCPASTRVRRPSISASRSRSPGSSESIMDLSVHHGPSVSSSA